jgi:GxxExxY protein
MSGRGLEAEELSRQIIGAAIAVHRELGPGLLESTYEACLAMELRSLGLEIQRQVVLPVRYRDQQIDAGYRLDLVVEQTVIVELKAVDQVRPIHVAQLMTYLKLSNIKVGLLLNFNVEKLIDGITRRVM